MQDKPTYALVVIAHPDDAEYGAAGTVARWIAEGKEVVYAVCTNGDKGTNDVKMDPKELAQVREQEQLAAARLLGVREVVFLRYPDQTLEDTPEFRKDIVRLIRMYKPEIVVTSDPHRRYISHRDHRIAGRVTLDAVFPYARDYLSYPDLLREGLQPHAVKEVWCWAPENSNHRSDITATFAVKMAALRCHHSQVGHFLSPEWEEQLRQRYKLSAEEEEFELAETFHRVEILW
jgi:LmbE family N-acetylglucosaminyl deacetylase